MNVKRWALVVALSAPGGFVWASAFVDPAPNWIGQTHGVLVWLLMFLPLAVLLACGTVFEWWRWPAALVYSVLLLALGAVGAAYGGKLYGCSCCRGEPWPSAILASLQVLTLLGGPFLALAWAVGRLGRKLARRSASAHPTEVL